MRYPLYPAPASSTSGGLIGDGWTITIENSYNSGNVSAKLNGNYIFAGGMVGYVEEQLTINGFNFYIGGDSISIPDAEITYADGAECKKVVFEYNPEDSVLEFNSTSAEFFADTVIEGKDRLSVTLTPHLKDKTGIKWESSNPDVVEIVSTDSSDGIFSDTLLCAIKCKSAGTSTITVTYTNGATASCVVTVKGIPYGDVDANGSINTNDAALLLKKVLDNSSELPIEKKIDNYMKYADVDADGILTAKDAAIILKKTLDSDFVMPV